MYNLLSLLTGVVISIMVAVNGNLTAQYGIFGATVIIHIVGCLFAFSIIKLRRQNAFRRGVPWWLYSGGVIGVVTTVMNNFTYGKISLTGIIALGLLGQTVMALAIDSFGLFGMRKYAFRKATLFGLAFAAVGIYVMLKDSFGSVLWAVMLSYVAGITVVLSRTVNAGLSERVGALQGSFLNHLAGFPVAVAALALMGRNDVILNSFSFSPRVWIYVGGALGVVVVFLYNITVPKIPAFRLTLLAFVGQIFAGVALDLITKQGYSKSTFIGGLLVAAGVGINELIERICLNKKRVRE